MFSKLQYISQGETAKVQLHNIQEALDAGCNWIQLRYKNASPDELLTLAAQVNAICTSYAATFIINDFPKIAKLIDADGVHLGLTDLNIAEAKAIVGNHKIIGGTANTLEHVLQRIDEGCSYVGLGPLRFTPTKAKLSPILGFEGYAAILQTLQLKGMEMPVYAIGGVEIEDLSNLMEIGLHGVAVSGLITQHQNKKQLIEQCNTILYENVNYSR